MNTDINAKIEKTDIKEITQDTVWQRMPMRIQDSHKGTYGKLLCVAGSSRYRGAAALTAEGALRGGCGIVTLASVEPVFASIQPRLPECILLSCLPDEKGGISEANAESLKAELSNDYAALLMGPGMGNTPDTGSLVRTLTQNAECTVILDADALNALTLPVCEKSLSNDMKKSQISSASKQQYPLRFTETALIRFGKTALRETELFQFGETAPLFMQTALPIIRSSADHHAAPRRNGETLRLQHR